MHISDINLTGFEKRNDLKKITRYHIYSPMYYRPDDYFHSIKVFHLVKEVIPRVLEVFGNSFDHKKAMIMALVHDDAELITGDITAGQKSKMTKAELDKIDQDEELAIKKLSNTFPKKIHNYNYENLLLEILHKNTIESQVVKYLDHIDAYCEGLHELYAGNKAFIINYIDPELGEVVLPHISYTKNFNSYKNKYPLIKKLMSKKLPFLDSYNTPDAERIVKAGTPHTLENLSNKFDNPVYEWWKNTLLNNLTQKEIENLYIPKEIILNKHSK